MNDYEFGPRPENLEEAIEQMPGFSNKNADLIMAALLYFAFDWNKFQKEEKDD